MWWHIFLSTMCWHLTFNKSIFPFYFSNTERKTAHSPKQSGEELETSAPLKRGLDDFRFEHRFQSRAEAIRWLLEWALDNGATPEEKD